MKKIVFVLLVVFVSVESVFSSLGNLLYITPIAFSPAVYTPRGDIGESITDLNYFSLLGKGWKIIPPRSTVQGLDHLYIKFEGNEPNAVIVADSKFTNSSSPLDTHVGQMSDEWIRVRMESDIIPNYSIYEFDSLGFKPPSTNASKYSIDGDTYLYFEGGNKYYFSESGIKRTEGYVRDHSNKVKEHLQNSIYGNENTKKLRKRVVQYKWDKDTSQLSENVYRVTDDGKRGELIDSRAIKDISGIEDEAIERVFLALDYPDTSVIASLTEDEKIRILSLNSQIDQQTFDKIYSSKENRIAINRSLGYESSDIIDFSAVSGTSRGKIILGKSGTVANEDVAKAIVKHKAVNSLKVGGVSAGVSGTLVFGLTLLSQLNNDGEVDILPLLNQSASASLIGFTSGSLTSIVSDATSGITNKALKEFFDLYGKKVVVKNGKKVIEEVVSEGSSKVIKGVGFKAVGKGLKVGLASSVLPAGVGFVIGVGVDYIRASNLPPELKSAIMKRSLLIEGISFGTGVATGTISTILAPVSAPIVPFIISGTDILSGIALEFLIPVPSEMDPDVIKKQIANDPTVIERWSLEGWNNIMRSQGII